MFLKLMPPASVCVSCLCVGFYRSIPLSQPQRALPLPQLSNEVARCFFTTTPLPLSRCAPGFWLSKEYRVGNAGLQGCNSDGFFEDQVRTYSVTFMSILCKMSHNTFVYAQTQHTHV